MDTAPYDTIVRLLVRETSGEPPALGFNHEALSYETLGTRFEENEPDQWMIVGWDMLRYEFVTVYDERLKSYEILGWLPAYGGN